jgi:hypothetical protein
MPYETSYMPSLKTMGNIYGENGGMPLCQEFHYESIFTWQRKLGLCCWCGDYWLDRGNGGFECH